MNDPINAIAWVKAETLTANNYNPNVVFSPELRLLERSILATGWVQPVLITPEGVLIDGFHRWRLSLDSPALMERYKGFLPAVVLDLPRPEAMALTVAMNRAKGTHVAVKMADLVKEIHEAHGQSREWIAERIGATLDEVDLLLQEGVFKAKKIDQWRYSRAWYPVEGGSNAASD